MVHAMRKPIKIWQLGTALAVVMLIAPIIPELCGGIIRWGINAVFDSTYGPDGSIARQRKELQAASLKAQNKDLQSEDSGR